MPNPHRSACIKARKLFESKFREVIEGRQQKAKRDPEYTTPNDLLQDLIDAQYRDGTKPSIEEITGILIGVLLGGQHTSNVTGTWMLVHLLKNTEWMSKVMSEQDEIVSTHRNPSDPELYLSYGEVQRMKVMEQVINETLRLHHPFFQLSRAVHKDSVFQDTLIPRGHFVNVAPSAAMRRPELFPDGGTFDPSRFGPEKKIPPYAFFPFGGGMHQCGGRKFAWNSLKASLGWLLRNYDIELIGKGATEMPKEDFTTMVVAPTRDHVKVRYRRRQISRK